MNLLKTWNPSNYQPTSNFEQLLGIDTKLNLEFDDIDMGAEEEKEVFVGTPKKVVSEFEKS